MPRTFIAVELAPDIRRPIVQLLRSLPRVRDVRWCLEPQLHITLKFLGEVRDAELPDVLRVVRDASAAVAPFEIRVGGLGCFPGPVNPRVLWCGVEDATAGCRRWVAAADPGLAELNFKPETRAFTPHITLGRSRSSVGARGLREVLESHDFPMTGAMLVEEVAVFESRLLPGGAQYHPLATVRLGD